MMADGRYEIAARLFAVRNGAVLKELNADEMKVTCSAEAEMKRSFSCRIRYDAEVDLLTDRLRPVQVIDGREYPLGEFLAATVSMTEQNGCRGWEAECYDQTLLLRQTTAAGALRFAVGTPYLSAVRSLLAECGITRVVAEPCPLTLSADREDWEPGTSYLSIANELLAAVNYEGIWFDSAGAARLGRARAASAGNVSHSYRAGEYSLLCEGITRESDAYEAYNVFTAVYSLPDAAPMTAVSVNDSPLSPVSTVRRGRKICAPVQFVEDIASREELQAFADRLRAESLLASETAEFETAPFPTHETGEIVALEGAIYRETGWTLRLGFGGSYLHRARRAILI